MGRLKPLMFSGVIAAALIFTAAVSYAGWWWDSVVDVEGSELRTVWEITDSNRSLYGYTADFTVYVPEKVNAGVLEAGTNQTVTIEKSSKLSCLSNGAEIEVDAVVSAGQGTSGTQTKITLIENDMVIAEKAGSVGETITQRAVLSSVDCLQTIGKPVDKPAAMDTDELFILFSRVIDIFSTYFLLW